MSRVLACGRGVLLDMDGTLVDSNGVVESMWREFAATFDLDPGAVIAFAHGRQTPTTVARFLPDLDAAERMRLATAFEAEEVERTDGVIEVPGAGEFLDRLASLGAPWALVTSATPALARSRMHAAGLPMPAVVVAATDVERGKPAPDGYLAAAALLGLRSSEAIVFEDADAGLQAALSAQARVIAVGSNATALHSELAQVPDFTSVGIRASGAWFEVTAS